MADLKTWTRSLVATTGAAIAGPAGAIIGTFLGGMIASLLPGTQDFSNQVFSNLSRMSIDGIRKNFEQKLTPAEKQRVNHDLQTAFRDAVREALYDIGGIECFPQLSASPRDVPIEVGFAKTSPGRTLWQRKNPLTQQIQECLQTIDQAIADQLIFPLDPPIDQASASVYSYLQADTPDRLSTQFFTENFSNILDRFGTLHLEVPELENHLRLHLYDRTLVHLGEHLKHRTPAWRAFNRLVLENMQNELSQLETGQSEIVERLKVLTGTTANREFDAWTDQMAELLAATGTISKQLHEGFDGLSERVVTNHREVIHRLDTISASSTRIEKKVDRVLQYLDQGRSGVDSDQRTIPMSRPPAPGVPPYKGLQSFTEADADLFFGRDKWITKILFRLNTTRFLAIIGASGSGKSSIVRAGVIPIIKGEKDLRAAEFKPANSQNWPVYTFTPSAHPLESLAAILEGSDQIDIFQKHIQKLRQDPHFLDLCLQQQAIKAGAAHVLLVVDQFEEIFTQCQDQQERESFISTLIHTANPEKSGVAILIIILRADFYANCADYEILRSVISSYQEYIGPMSSEEIRLAIEEPASKLGWKFEPGLVDLILHDAGQEPGMLPLLSHALMETWRNRSSHTMTLDSYAQTGGVKGAIARTAELVYHQQLSADQQIIAQKIFLRLTNLEEGAQDTRRRSSLKELITNPGQADKIEKVVNLLAKARLLTIENDAIDVAHEALIREWPTLRNWIDENRSALKIHQRLAAAAQEWQRFKQDEGLLYRGLRLQEALEWSKDSESSPNEDEREFLKSSQDLVLRQVTEREEQQRRELAVAQKLAVAEKQRAEEQLQAAQSLRRREYFLRLALAGAGVLAIFAVIFAVLASVSSQQANTNAMIAQTASTKAVAESYTRATAEVNALSQGRISQVREIAARSRSLIDRDQDMALLLGSQALKLANLYGEAVSPEAQTALYQALTSANYSSTFRGHDDALNTASFSPDGQSVITSSQDGTAMVWGLDGRRLSVLTGHKGPVTGAAYSHDGRMILTYGEDMTARLWKPDGTPIRSLEGHTKQINFAVFSPDNLSVLTVSSDRTARLWTVSTGSSVILSGHTDVVEVGQFSPDGSTLATAGGDATVRLWKNDGTFLTSLKGHSSWIVSLQFSPDGSKILTGSWDKTAKIWQIDGKLLNTMEGHKSYINHSSFSPDGSKIVTAGSDNLAKIWSSSGDLLANLPGHTQQVNKALFSPDGTTIVTVSLDNTVKLWQSDGTPLAVLRGHSGFIYDIAYNKDGSKLVTASGDLTARIWQTNQLVHIISDHFGAVTTASFSPDGNSFLTGSTDGFIRLRRLDGVKLREFYTEGPINRAAFSPDGKRILVATNKNDAIVYSLDGDEILRLTGHTAKLLDAQFSPDSSKIVTASQDGTAILWKYDGSQISVLKGHTGPVESARFSPDSSLVITASDDKTARLWKTDGSAPTGKIVHPESLSFASFAPDGNRIVTACWDGNAYLWKSDGTAISIIQGHTSALVTSEFSPDGRLILTSSIDSTARLWDSKGQFIASLEGHTTWLNSADFSPDGNRIITTSWDGTARIWRGYAKIADLVADSDQKVNRLITKAECFTFLHLDRCP